MGRATIWNVTNPPRPVAPAPPLLPAVATILLVVAGGLAIGGSFGKLEEESERAGSETLTLTYTSWHLTQGGTYPMRIYFHAPHFGIPLVITGVLTIATGLMLAFGRGVLARLAKPAAVASAGLLVGTVWTVGLVVSADLDAVTHSEDFDLTWTSGVGFWVLLTSGIAGVVGGLITLFGNVVVHDRVEPPTPSLGIPVVYHVSPESPFIPQPAQQVDPLGGHPAGPAPLPLFQPPTPPTPSPNEPA